MFNDSDDIFKVLRDKVRTLFTDIQKEFTYLYSDDEHYIKMRLPVKYIEKDTIPELRNAVKNLDIKPEIHVADKSEINDLNNIYHQSWIASDLPMKGVTQELIRDIFNDKNTRFLIAQIENKNVGFILVEFDKKNEDIGIISGIGILPEHQSLGLGKFLALQSWKFFKEKNVKTLQCEVYEKNVKGIKFIKSLGFQEYGEKEDRSLLK
ncbi:MAG: GNAT family N-acetyltransferase [Candidatus Lokiarchaeota archaeon]|nr:GNAT family N-acetyltransferase [Candidatus Lokiarchaeota archaeon]MBD3199727.1 GNAT family N-acetyltransferase [Candidatus Lokiarchaeota archaeon]